MLVENANEIVVSLNHSIDYITLNNSESHKPQIYNENIPFFHFYLYNVREFTLIIFHDTIDIWLKQKKIFLTLSKYA